MRINYLMVIVTIPLFLSRENVLAQIASSRTDVRTLSVEDSLRMELRNTKQALAYVREEATRMLYLGTAKEMALRSTELKDSILQALVAVQAYSFHMRYMGNPHDIEIYRALYSALHRFNDPMIKTLPLNVKKEDQEFLLKTNAIVSKLCSCAKRNMNIDEWNKYSYQLPFEKTCAAN